MSIAVLLSCEIQNCQPFRKRTENAFSLLISLPVLTRSFSFALFLWCILLLLSSLFVLCLPHSPICFHFFLLLSIIYCSSKKNHRALFPPFLVLAHAAPPLCPHLPSPLHPLLLHCYLCGRYSDEDREQRRNINGVIHMYITTYSHTQLLLLEQQCYYCRQWMIR